LKGSKARKGLKAKLGLMVQSEMRVLRASLASMDLRAHRGSKDLMENLVWFLRLDHLGMMVQMDPMDHLAHLAKMGQVGKMARKVQREVKETQAHMAQKEQKGKMDLLDRELRDLQGHLALLVKQVLQLTLSSSKKMCPNL